MNEDSIVTDHLLDAIEGVMTAHFSNVRGMADVEYAHLDQFISRSNQETATTAAFIAIEVAIAAIEVSSVGGRPTDRIELAKCLIASLRHGDPI